MSHQTRQLAKVKISSLDVLERILPGIYFDHLNTHLVLDRSRKTARYYGTAVDSNPKNVAVITYGRPLTDVEKYSNYEIAVREEESEEVSGVKVPVYSLYADIHGADRLMKDKKLGRIGEEILIDKIRVKTMPEINALEFEEMPESDAPEGHRRIRLTIA